MWLSFTLDITSLPIKSKVRHRFYIKTGYFPWMKQNVIIGTQVTLT